MQLLMDQRYLPLLLIECANATLPIEVKHLRINPDQSGGQFAAGTASRGGSVRMGDVEGADTLAQVEIRGVVYIYMRPNAVSLGLTSDDVAALESATSQR
jgi:hypothetical protein